MIVKEYKPNAKPGERINVSRVNSSGEAMSLMWVQFKGAAEMWPPDEHGYGLITSRDGRVIAIILEE